MQMADMEIQQANEHQSLLADLKQKLEAEKKRADAAEQRADTAEQTIKTVKHRYVAQFGKDALYRSVYRD